MQVYTPSSIWGWFRVSGLWLAEQGCFPCYNQETPALTFLSFFVRSILLVFKLTFWSWVIFGTLSAADPSLPANGPTCVQSGCQKRITLYLVFFSIPWSCQVHETNCYMVFSRHSNLLPHFIMPLKPYISIRVFHQYFQSFTILCHVISEE